MSATENNTTDVLACILHAEHGAMLEANAPDPAIDAVLARYTAELRRLATTPATTTAALREKARALATCVQVGNSRPPTVTGDYGLAASLVADVLALA